MEEAALSALQTHCKNPILLVISCLFIIKSGQAEINWNGNNWAVGCQFNGNELFRIASARDDCGDHCQKHPNCTHFTYLSSTCLLQYGAVEKSSAVASPDPGGICGVPQAVLIGTTSRYWDCCKPSCAAPGQSEIPCKTCLKDGLTTVNKTAAINGCDGGEAYICSDNAPWAVGDQLAFGFAAGRLKGVSERDICCTCYKLNFTNGPVVGQTMVIQVINSHNFYDTEDDHFSLLMPGSGEGTHPGCIRQWNISEVVWGEGLTQRQDCNALPEALRTGCRFRFHWFQNANGPAITYSSVPCPDELVKRSRCNRNAVTPVAVVEQSSGETRSIIIGVTVSLAWLVICAVFAVGMWFRRKRRVKGFKNMNRVNFQVSGVRRGLISPDSHPAVAAYAELLDVPRENVDLSDIVLGKGHYGLVYKATATKLPTVPRDSIIVAVKMLCGDVDIDSENEFVAEFHVMLKAGRHINVVNILGIVQEGVRPMLILEYCKFGCLQNYIRNHKKGKIYAHVDDEGNLLPFDEDEVKRRQSIIPDGDYRTPDISSVLSTSDLIRFSHQISRGMAYLSSRSIIHRDLAARNVLVAENKIVKISDFGLARHGEDSYTASSPFLALPILWMPPEAITHRLFSQKSDVWSFGVTLWELFSLGEVPFSGLDVVKFSASGFAEWLLAKNQMPRTEGTPLVIYDLMQKCWSLEPTDRPTFSEVWDVLDKIVDGMSRAELGMYLDLLQATEPSPLEEKFCQLSEQILLIPESGP